MMMYKVCNYYQCLVHNSQDKFCKQFMRSKQNIHLCKLSRLHYSDNIHHGTPYNQWKKMSIWNMLSHKFYISILLGNIHLRRSSNQCFRQLYRQYKVSHKVYNYSRLSNIHFHIQNKYLLSCMKCKQSGRSCMLKIPNNISPYNLYSQQRFLSTSDKLYHKLNILQLYCYRTSHHYMYMKSKLKQKDYFTCALVRG